MSSQQISDFQKQMKLVNEVGLRDQTETSKVKGISLKENSYVAATLMYDKMTGKDSQVIKEEARLLGAMQAIKEISSDVTKDTVNKKLNSIRKIISSI